MMKWPFVSRAREHEAFVRYVVSAVLKADPDNALYRPGQFVPLREDNVRRCLDWLVSIANERREIMAKLEEDKASMAEAHAATRAELAEVREVLRQMNCAWEEEIAREDVVRNVRGQYCPDWPHPDDVEKALGEEAPRG